MMAKRASLPPTGKTNLETHPLTLPTANVSVRDPLVCSSCHRSLGLSFCLALGGSSVATPNLQPNINDRVDKYPAELWGISCFGKGLVRWRQTQGSFARNFFFGFFFERESKLNHLRSKIRRRGFGYAVQLQKKTRIYIAHTGAPHQTSNLEKKEVHMQFNRCSPYSHRATPPPRNSLTSLPISYEKAIIFLISAIAFPGFNPLGQVRAQFMIVWHR